MQLQAKLHYLENPINRFHDEKMTCNTPHECLVALPAMIDNFSHPKRHQHPQAHFEFSQNPELQYQICAFPCALTQAPDTPWNPITWSNSQLSK
jgi:hypothetical protein